MIRGHHDHSYFSISYQPSTYSYVYAATSRGYSTFNIDRIGVGASGKPPASQLTVQTHAYTIEQIVRKLRAGAIGGRAFTTVVGIGHSLGAGILQYLAGMVTDPLGVPNYLVFSGWLHVGNVPALTTLGSSLYAASSDPAFAGVPLPADYLTTMPSTRGTNFYYAQGAEAAMITLDESLKQTGTITERQTLAAVRASTVTLNITVPVLLSVGQYDSLQCNESAGLSCATPAAVIAREAASYGTRACLKAFVVSATGHSVSLHIKARDSYNEAHSWLDNYTINGVNSKDANGCLP
jgi:pimeloyl-ACP methyl ester carboxylesterase